jgi:hypothetical protein
LDTIEMLSPGFYEAPSARRVTILFTMLDRWQNIKNWSERHPARKIILQESKSLVSLQVCTACPSAPSLPDHMKTVYEYRMKYNI